jgi:hypothetical protein
MSSGEFRREEDSTLSYHVKVPAPRFTLVSVMHVGPGGELGYVTGWDDWEGAAAAFPIEPGYRLYDNETGRVWHPGARYVWEDAQT